MNFNINYDGIIIKLTLLMTTSYTYNIYFVNFFLYVIMLKRKSI